MPDFQSQEDTQQQFHNERSRAIARVLYPVMICMALSVYLVHSLGDEDKCLDTLRRVTPSPLSGDTGVSGSSDSNDIYDGKGGIIFIAIFVTCLVVFTFALMLLYKYGCMKIIFGWLLVAVSLIYAYVGGVYLFDFCRSHCINIDWITLVVVVWNFSITGLLAVFSSAPRLVNQGYLIVMSALMAYIFRRLPEWTTWAILVILVVWDLIAVLTPCGPLNKLVQIARVRGDPMPALIYDTNPNDVGRDRDAQPAVVFHSKEVESRIKERLAAQKKADAEARAKRNGPATSVDYDSGESSAYTSETTGAESTQVSSTATHGRQSPPKSQQEQRATGTANSRSQARPIGTLGHHLKLGLGDFVFYSILVAQASNRGAMTTVISFIAILNGLCATLFLVTVYRKALPALPISIVLGLVFFFLTRFTIQPFVENLLPELLFH